MNYRVVREDGRCKHLTIPDEEFTQYWDRQVRTWGAAPGPLCPTCGYLYPHIVEDEVTGEEIIRISDEPQGAGRDYWGRPSDPEYWQE